MTVLLAAALLCGQSFAEIVPVTRDTSAQEPQVAVAGDGSVYVAYGIGKAVYCSVSRNQGASYEEPVKVAEAGELALGMRRGPRIAVVGDRVIVSAVYGKKGGGRDGDILAWRTVDQGKTWKGPAKVNDVAGAAREGLHAMAGGPNGLVACAWLDLRDRGTRIYESFSKDGGQTWAPNTLVYESPDGTVCQCCHPSIAYGPDGKLFVMWRNALGGSRDMYIAASNDGSSFGTAVKLGSGTWPLDACPMDGGGLAIGSDGAISTVWRRENRIIQCFAGQPEQDMGIGEQPWAATGPAGFYKVWLTKRGGTVQLLNPGSNGQPTALAGSGDDPVIAAGPKGPVIAAWTVPGGGIASKVVGS